MSIKPQIPSINFNDLDLAKTLDPAFLNQLSLDELIRLKRVLIKRVAAVLGEIGELRASDDFERQQYAKRLFRCQLEHNGKILFKHELDRHVDAISNDKNFFIPGAWFRKYELELEQLREQKAANVAAAPEREREQLIEELLGSASIGV